MATKVLGETIKEGSIPYNALRDVPDWSASEGEGGYIKNKTHFANFKKIDVEPGITQTIFISDFIGNDRVFCEIMIHGASFVMTFDSNHTTNSITYQGVNINITRGAYSGEIIITCNSSFTEDAKCYLYAVRVSKYLSEYFIPSTIARLTDIPTVDSIKEAQYKYILDPIYIRGGETLPSEMVNENGKIKDEFCHKAFFAPTIVVADGGYDEESGEPFDVLAYLAEVNNYTDTSDNIIYKGTNGTYAFEINDGIIYQNWG